MIWRLIFVLSYFLMGIVKSQDTLKFHVLNKSFRLNSLCDNLIEIDKNEYEETKVLLEPNENLISIILEGVVIQYYYKNELYKEENRSFEDYVYIKKYKNGILRKEIRYCEGFKCEKINYSKSGKG